MASIKPKIILVCKALVKVIGHAELVPVRETYQYLNDLDVLCIRMIAKYTHDTEDGVGELPPPVKVSLRDEKHE